MRLLTSTFLCLTMTPALAADQGKIIGGSEVLSMIVSLVIVVAAIVALGWLYSRSKLTGTGSRDVINVVASRALGTKERLLIVEIADQQILLGITATQVSTLHTFDKPVVAEAELQAPTPFAERLKTSLEEIRK